MDGHIGGVGSSLLLGFKLAFRMVCVNSAGPGVIDCGTSGTGMGRQASSATVVANTVATIHPFHELLAGETRHSNDINVTEVQFLGQRGDSGAQDQAFVGEEYEAG